MRDSLQNRCNLFLENRDLIKSAFGWESSYIYPMCASLYTSKDILADTEKMKACKSLLKEKTGIFSNFRGTAKMATVTMLTFSTYPEEQMEKMLAVYDKLKEVFWGSEFLTIASSIIAEMAEPIQYEEIVKKTRAIYDRMKKKHPMLTNTEDTTYATLLAMSGFDDQQIEEEAERCYKILKPSFFSGNAVQSISHILALGEQPAEEKCAKVMGLYNYLRQQGYKYGTSYEFATLGGLALTNAEIEVLAADIMAVDDFLKPQKGFGAFGIGSKQRLMYAALMTMCDYVPDTKNLQAAALNGVVALVIAQQVAICASVAATSAATASSSSGD